MKKIIFVGILTIILTFGIVFAVPQISISTDKSTYDYGQSLSFTIRVSEVTGDMATFEIVDQSGQSSSTIHIQITKSVSSITAPVPFYRTTFPPGTYYINIQYSGSNATTSFQIVDTGEIVIPPQFKVVADSWSKGQTSDNLFAHHIQELIHSGIIKITNYQQKDTTFIPTWVKNNARWWANGSISDDDFGLAIKYLVDSKIIRV
jgi:hypothetical protein